MISNFMAGELADVWANMAEMEREVRLGRRETLRECADALRMLSSAPAPNFPGKDAAAYNLGDMIRIGGFLFHITGLVQDSDGRARVRLDQAIEHIEFNVEIRPMPKDPT